MSLNSIVLPNEVIHRIIFFCQSSSDYASLALVNNQWYSESIRLNSLMKKRFSRQKISLAERMIIWNFDYRSTVIGHGDKTQRHGLEECVQVYHRVGGPGASVYYLERHWRNGKLHGEEILREINSFRYNTEFSTFNEENSSKIEHPYEGLKSIDSMKSYRAKVSFSQFIDLNLECDQFGLVLFRHSWNDATMEQSFNLKRSISNYEDQTCSDSLYDYVHHFDVKS